MIETRILPYEDRWQPGAAAVVKAVFDEYGLTWDPDAYHRDLFTVRETYLDTGGMFSVLVLGEQLADEAPSHGGNPASAVPRPGQRRTEVIGTVGGFDRGDAAEIERLYLLAEHRGRGHGRAMVEHFVRWASGRRFDRLIAWSDKRFENAHGLYQRLGFRLVGDRICPGDPDESPEWGFELDLR